MKFYQRGAISGALAAGLVVFGILATLVGLGMMSYVSAYNYGNEQEVLIAKVWENNQNVLGQYTLKVQEMAQVPAMYKDDLKDVMTSAMTARMGEGGSKAVVQWFKEQNIPFDSSLYSKLQQVMEAGRNEFQREQTRLVDVKAEYQKNLGYLWRGMWLRIAGYPKLDLSKYQPVVAEDTRQIFKQGSQAPIKLR